MQLVIQSLNHLGHAEHSDAGSREFDRQWDAVEPPARFGDGPRVRVCNGQTGEGGSGPFDKQPSSIVVGQRRRR
jgi:hypothetical protein